MTGSPNESLIPDDLLRRKDVLHLLESTADPETFERQLRALHDVGQAPMCCHDGCHSEAEFSIHDSKDRRPDMGVTDSCTRHVGDLLGFSYGAEEHSDGWMVVPLAARRAMAEEDH